MVNAHYAFLKGIENVNILSYFMAIFKQNVKKKCKKTGCIFSNTLSLHIT